MKKATLLLLFLLCAGISKTFAGYLNIINMTPCSYTLTSGFGRITDPVTGVVYPFTFGPVTINPGPNNFSNVTLLPGFSTTAPAVLQASGCVYHNRLLGPGFQDFMLGYQNSSFTSTNNPPCNNGINYMATWNLSGNGCDAVILIL